MVKKKIVALVTAVIMTCSLFVGIPVSAAGTGQVKLEVYKVNEGDFGDKIDLTQDKLKVNDEIIVAIQVYGFDKIVGSGGLCGATFGLTYDSSTLVQSMEPYANETILTQGESTAIGTSYANLDYVVKNSALSNPRAPYSTVPEEYNKELKWYTKLNSSGKAAYQSFDIEISNNTGTSERYLKVMTASGGAYYENASVRPLAADPESKKMLYAFKFKVAAIPTGGNTELALDTSSDTVFKIDKWLDTNNDGGSALKGQGYQVLTGAKAGADGSTSQVMEAVTPISVNYELPATTAPTATLTEYGNTDNKRTVNVTSDVTDTVIKVYADQNKTKLLATGAKGANAVEIARGANAGDSDIVKALNLGVMYVTATKDGAGESAAVKVTADARQNVTKITADKTLTGTTYSVPKGSNTTTDIDKVTPALPTETMVDITYDPATGAEGSATGTVALTNWAFANGADLTQEGTVTVEAAFAVKANSGITLQANANTFKAKTDVTVSAVAVSSVTAKPATVTYDAEKAYNHGTAPAAVTTGVDALAAWLAEDVKVDVTYADNTKDENEATTWTLKAGQTYDPKGGTFVFESAAFGGKQATVSVTVTPVKGKLSETATAKEVKVSGLDANLELITKPQDAQAAKALMPSTTVVTFEDKTTEEYPLTWTPANDFSYGNGTDKVTDGEVLGNMTRVVGVPAWLTTEPALNAAPDTVKVVVSATVAGVKAKAANFPDKTNDMILIDPADQENAAIKQLVVKAGTKIEFFANNTGHDAEPVLTYTVTADDVTANKVLIRINDINDFEFPKTGKTLYAGINIGGTKTPAADRVVMVIDPEPEVEFVSANSSLKVGDSIGQTAKLNGTYTIDTDSIVWESDNTSVVTVSGKAMTTTVRGVGKGTTTVRFKGNVVHPFAAVLGSAAVTAPVQVEKSYTVTEKNNSGGGGRRPSGSTGSGGVVVVPSNTSYFDDIENVTWAKDKINALAEKGIINGVADRIFAPDNTVTRAEFAKMIVGAFGIYDANATMNFADTQGKENEWYYKYVASAAKRGIILGYEEDNTFRPDRTITREEMCAIVARACKTTGRTLVGNQQPITFNDEADIMGYAKEAVDQMTRAGIVNGMGDNMFVPKGNATRAQAAKIIYDVTIG